MGFQSFGSNPHWTRYNSKPKESCAVSGNRLTSSLLPPIQTTGFTRQLCYISHLYATCGIRVQIRTPDPRIAALYKIGHGEVERWKRVPRNRPVWATWLVDLAVPMMS